MRCFACECKDHRTADCSSRISTSHNELNSCFHLNYYYKCSSTGPDTKDYWNLLLHSQTTLQQPRGEGTDGKSTQIWQVECAIQELLKNTKKDIETEMETLKLKSQKIFKVLNGACMDVEIKDYCQ